MKTLVKAYGSSIGKRHTRLMTELRGQMTVVSRHSVDFVPYFFCLTRTLNSWQPVYVVMANSMGEHLQTIESLIKHAFQERVGEYSSVQKNVRGRQL